MAVADDGTLYFSYKEDGVVKVVPPQGPPHLLPEPELGFSPENLIVLKNGDVLVCDVLTNQIYRYKPDGRHFYEPFVYPDPADPILGRLRNPRALLEAPNGDIYLADSENNAIRRYGADNVPATHAGVENPRGATDGPVASAKFRSPQHAIESPAGTTYVTDSYACTIRAIADGVVTTLAGKPRECSEVDGPRDVARLYYPSMLAYAPNGDLIFTSWSGSIRKVAPDGTVATLRRGASHATGLAVSKSGEVFFASLDKVYKLEADGTRTLFSDLSSRIESIVFDDDGMLLVATGRGIFRVGSSGNPSEFDSQRWGALGMLMEPGGYLLVADFQGNFLFRYDREGRGRALSSRLSSTGVISPFGSLEGMSRRRDGLILTTDFQGASVRLAVPALADRATIDAPFGPKGEERLLRPHPRTGAEHVWELVRRPTASRSQPQSSAPGEATFLPDVEGFYVFRLTAKGPGSGASVSEVSFRTRDSAAASFAAVPRCRVEDYYGYIRAVWSTFVVGPGACGIPATATALVLEVTVPEPRESGAISLSPDIGAAPHPGAINFKRAPLSAQVVVDLSPEGQFRIDLRDPALPSVAEYVDVDIVGYFGEVPQSRNPPRITP
ncbi:MAG: hypothetical protein JNK60_05175 [Acidobacteria bacterium]|nr:hypothetical protein [Acidobacteriota bacterium]